VCQHYRNFPLDVALCSFSILSALAAADTSDGIDSDQKSDGTMIRGRLRTVFIVVTTVLAIALFVSLAKQVIEIIRPEYVLCGTFTCRR
jgi:hypothetical protein